LKSAIAKDNDGPKALNEATLYSQPGTGGICIAAALFLFVRPRHFLMSIHSPVRLALLFAASTEKPLMVHFDTMNLTSKID